jgi:hypothetical protein
MGKVGAGRTAELCLPTPPSEPCLHLSAHTALQGLTSAPSVTTRLVMFVVFIAASTIVRDRRLTTNSGGTKQLLNRSNVNPLASFPMYAAFPHSEYYDASDAHAFPRWTAHLPA